jgi:hypothetical protein
MAAIGIAPIVKTKLLRTDAYDDMANAYQSALIAELNETLKENGVTKKAVRRKICERFFFAFGNFHDQYWFKAGGQKCFPLLCFSQEFLNTNTKVTELGEVQVPSDGYAMHDASAGNVECYFDDQKEKRAIEANYVGADVPKETPPALPSSGWLGGEHKAGAWMYAWSDHPTGPVEYRIRQGADQVVKPWAKLPRRREDDPPFGGKVMIEKPGKYEADFRCGETVFSTFAFRLT